MDFIDFAIEFLVDNSVTFKPLFDRLISLNVKLLADCGDERIDISKMVSDLRRNQKQISEIHHKACPSNQGGMIIHFSGHDIIRIAVGEDGHNQVHLVFLDGKASDFFSGMSNEIDQFRQLFVDHFDDDDLQDLIDLTADFLAQCEDREFSYLVLAKDKPFIKGTLKDQDLEIQLIDPAVYLKLLLFFMEGSNFVKVKISSPSDLFKLIEGLQDGIRVLSETYQLAELQLRIVILDQQVFSAGRGVSSNFSSSLGPTNIKLDSLFKSLSAVVSRF